MVRNPKIYEEALVSCLEAAIGFAYDIFSESSEKMGLRRLGRKIQSKLMGAGYQPAQAYKVTYELKRRNYVRVIHGDSVVLTDKAKLKIIDKISAEAKDSKFRILSFDIPEELRVNRDGFRRTIKRMGFVQIQKSLWVTTKNLSDLVEIAAAEYEVTDYIAYFIVEKSNIDNHIRKALGIKA